MRLLGTVFPLWVSGFGYSLPVVVLPALRCFARSEYCLIICFYRFGGCSFGWSVCFPLAVSLVARPGFLFGFPCAAFDFVLFSFRGSMALYFASFRLFLLSSVKYKSLLFLALFRLFPACVLFAVFKVHLGFTFAHLGRLYNAVCVSSFLLI